MKRNIITVLLIVLLAIIVVVTGGLLKKNRNSHKMWALVQLHQTVLKILTRLMARSNWRMKKNVGRT